MKRAADLTDQRFGKLTVKQGYGGKYDRKWICICDCGQMVSRSARSLTQTSNPHCGCEGKRGKRP